VIKQADRLRFLALCALATAVIISYSRTFTGTSWMFPALIAAWLSISSTHALLRTRLWRTTVFAITLVLGIWFIALVIFPQTTFLALPTPRSVISIVRGSAAAWARTQEEFAPVVPDAGFLTLLMGTAWIAGSFSTIPLKGGSSKQSILSAIPWVAVFGYSAAVGTTEGRQIFVGLFIVTLIIYLFSDTWRSVTRTQHFSGAGPAMRQPRMIEQSALAARIGAFSIVGAFLIPAVLPGYGDAPVIPWSETGPAKRTEISPFVQIAPRLTEAPQTKLFTVKANQAAYWRLTSLNKFNGKTWELIGDFERTGREVQLSRSPNKPVAKVTQNYQIFGLAGGWVPAAYAPSSIEGVKVLLDPIRDTLLTDALRPGMRYEVSSELPQPTVPQLQSAGVGGVPPEFLELPSDLPPPIAALSQQISKGEPTVYGKALAIQQHLRSFAYTERISAGHSADYLVRFLFRVKAGYCEQFAGAMAVMLRTLGIPARVAVGFLPGQQSGDIFTVTNREAHAWPEAYFTGVGWVAFEPTPRSEAAPPPYAIPAPSNAETITPEPPVTPEEDPAEEPPPDFAQELQPTVEPPAAVPDTPIDFATRATVRILAGSAVILALLFIIKQTWLLLPAALASTERTRAQATFREFLARASDVSRRRRIGETYLEYARTVQELSGVSTDKLVPIVRAYHQAEYSNFELDEENLGAAVEAMKQLRKSFWQNASWPRRFRLLFSPLPLVEAFQRVALVRSSIRASSAARSV
jgi:hypothetical protein